MAHTASGAVGSKHQSLSCAVLGGFREGLSWFWVVMGEIIPVMESVLFYYHQYLLEILSPLWGVLSSTSSPLVGKESLLHFCLPHIVLGSCLCTCLITSSPWQCTYRVFESPAPGLYSKWGKGRGADTPGRDCREQNGDPSVLGEKSICPGLPRQGCLEGGPSKVWARGTCMPHKATQPRLLPLRRIICRASSKGSSVSKARKEWEVFFPSASFCF